jgi:hypothetical protein
MAVKIPRIRGDLSDRLIHLTRGDSEEFRIKNDRAAQMKFLSIVRSKTVLGSAIGIKDGSKCICFSEAPIAVLARMLADRESRYAPLGVMLDKTYLFARGGRPVIYQPPSELGALPADIQYRHVDYDPVEGVDWTWEREWRVKADKLELDPAYVTLIVPRRSDADSLKEEYFNQQRGLVESYESTDFLELMQTFPWHFLVLEDLGISVVDFG